MNCPKCASLMFRSYPVRYHARSTDMSDATCSTLYGCVLCGTYVDNTILANKAAQRATVEV